MQKTVYSWNPNLMSPLPMSCSFWEQRFAGAEEKAGKKNRNFPESEKKQTSHFSGTASSCTSGLFYTAWAPMIFEFFCPVPLKLLFCFLALFLPHSLFIVEFHASSGAIIALWLGCFLIHSAPVILTSPSSGQGAPSYSWVPSAKCLVTPVCTCSWQCLHSTVIRKCITHCFRL